jgi:hypothetical protein
VATDKLKERQELYNGFGDTFTRGIEIVLVPVIFGAFGYLLDWVFGIVPVLTIVIGLIGVVGVAVQQYYRYSAQMEVHEAEGPWKRR